MSLGLAALRERRLFERDMGMIASEDPVVKTLLIESRGRGFAKTGLSGRTTPRPSRMDIPDMQESRLANRRATEQHC